MSDDVAEMAERHGRLLGRIAEMASSLAEALHADAMAAETPEARATSATAFHRMARSLRQTLAIEMRLLRERKALTREDAAEVQRREDVRASARKAQVRAGVVRLIWSEREKDDAEELEREVDERLGEQALLDDDFANAPIAVLVARLATELGLIPPDAPEAHLDDAAPPLESSA